MDYYSEVLVTESQFKAVLLYLDPKNSEILSFPSNSSGGISPKRLNTLNAGLNKGG
jgi:hypothetical protein